MSKIKLNPRFFFFLRKFFIYAFVLLFGIVLFVKVDELELKSETLQTDLETLRLKTSEEKGKFFELRKNFAGISGVEYGAEILFRLSGSNTLGDELTPALAAGYLQEMGAVGQIRISRFKNNPNRIVVKANIPGQDWPQGIDIRAEGSETAFKDLSSGNAEIAMSSRLITSSEVKSLNERGVAGMDELNARRIVAQDGLALIVHPQNPVTSLSMQQIQDAFSGKLRDWILIGGGNGKISLYVRDENSGSRAYFSKEIMKSASILKNAKTFASNHELVRAVLADKNALGVVSLPYIGEAKPLAIIGGDGVPVHPIGASVLNHSYPISRPLFLYSPTKTENFFAREFLAFAMSERGQDIVEKSGFVKSQEVRTITFGKVEGQNLPQEYLKIVESSEQLALTLRFRSNQSDLQAKSKTDLDRLRKFIEDNRNSINKIYLVGLSDNNGQADENLRLSLQRAEVVRKSLLSRGVAVEATQVVATGFGDVKPLAPNTTEEGRAMNRRVEVWIERK